MLILLVSLFLITSVPVSADPSYDDTYVNAVTGDESYNGSSPTYTGGSNGPTKRISAAIANTNLDGTVHVASGTYTELVHLNYSMNLIGDGALTTTINGNGQGCVVTVSSAPSQNNTISGFTITGGAPSGSDSGGGIYISDEHIVTINDCTITGNYRGAGSGSTAGFGGGICNNNGKVYINRCTISSNSAVNGGGGIANLKSLPGDQWGIMEITNSTISNNSVILPGFGGGLCACTDATTRLLNVTIAYNHADCFASAGGGFYNESTTSMYFKNCIVAHNTAYHPLYQNGFDIPGTGTHSQGNNLCSDNRCYFYDPTDQVNTDPLLGPLQNNGGPTSTHAITTLSPAYNRGDRSASPTTDQRGVARPTGAFCSIGAFEPPPDTRSATANTNLGAVNFNINTGTISGLINIKPAGITCSSPSGYILPYGMFSFNINNINAGSSVQVTLKFPYPLPLGIKYYKCINGNMIDCTSLITRLDPYTLILTLTDGGLGDSDGIANGVIADPGGPCFPLSTPQSSSAQMPITAQQAPVSLSNITVKSASISASKTAPGEHVTVTASVSNTGTGNGTSVIKVYVNGAEDAQQGVSVNSGGTSTVTFDISRNEPGTYSVYVGGTQAGSFTVDSLTPDTILFTSCALVFFALVTGVIYMVRRRA